MKKFIVDYINRMNVCVCVCVCGGIGLQLQSFLTSTIRICVQLSSLSSENCFLAAHKEHCVDGSVSSIGSLYSAV